MELIEEAKQCVSRALVESLAPGGFWQGSEWKAPSPLRADSNSCDSFHIYLDGSDWIYKDFVNGEGGDMVKLVSLLHACNQGEAARWILDQTGHTPAPKAKPGRKPKAPWCAAPADAKPRHPTIPIDPDLVTPYRLADKTIAYAILRWEAGARTTWNREAKEWQATPEKTVRPVYYTTEGKWVDGLPEQYKRNRLLLGLPRLAGEPRPGLILEGERKAQDSLGIVKSRVVTAWHGGADNARYVDVEPIQDWPDLVMWPDHDEPGRKAAMDLKAKLPQLEILDVWRNSPEKPDGWDIADAIKEGIDVEEYIANCPWIGPPPRVDEEDDDPDEPAPFQCIGYDPYQYYFLLGRQRQLFTITKGRFSVSNLQELAPKKWWLSRGCEGEKGGIAIQEAQDIVVAMQEGAGLFSSDSLRGAGVWMDAKKIVLNDSDNIIDLEGRVTPLSEYHGKANYVRSSIRFGDMMGEAATADEGRALLDLFDACLFQRRIDAIAVAGWSLISPFGGILKVRPHIWLTGRRGTGKTWVLEQYVEELAGPFAHIGSGTDTEAGIRRTLNQDARPVIIDEAEGKDKASRVNMAKILNLARNSFSDGSGYVTMADGSGHGTVRFLIRSCFCFASVNSIQDEGAAIASRIIMAELKKPETISEEQAKVAACLRLAKKAMREPERFRRRTFRALPRILEDIRKLRIVLPQYLGGQREADLWAPILAAAWSVQSDESVACDAGTTWLEGLVSEDTATRTTTPEDEDRVIEHILAAQVITDDRKVRTVAELLALAYNAQDAGEAEGLLGRHGLRIMAIGGARYLAIACRHDQLSRVLRDTPYEVGYDAQVKRNHLCVNPDKPKQERMGGATTGCRLLDWAGFRERYMGKGED